MHDLLKPSEAAQALRCTSRQIHYMVADGRLRGTRPGKKTLLIYRSSIDDLLKRSEIHANS